jgi:8-oxo-dGTP pyrophosphatase MutT (NUDIX family)
MREDMVRPRPDIADLLVKAFSKPLPGRPAQDRMLSDFRRRREAAPQAGRAWRPASVLVLLYPDEEGDLAFPLVERSSDVGHHRGEIALPGGGLEAGETAAEAALREAREELCLAPEAAAGIGLYGGLTPLRVPSGFEIFPFVGSLAARPALAPRRGEIEDVFEVKLGALLDPATTDEEDRWYEGEEWRVPYYSLGGRKVWGATAMILAELAAMIAAELAAHPASG